MPWVLKGSSKGPTGATPKLTAGTVSTVPAGTPAEATITGTPEDPVLNLTIPEGRAGDPVQAPPAITRLELQQGTSTTPGIYSPQVLSAEIWRAVHIVGDDLEDQLLTKITGNSGPFSDGVFNLTVMTEAAYQALPTKSSNTVYLTY